jgi:hypothetical protein
MGLVIKQSLMQRFNNKWAHKAHKPIKMKNKKNANSWVLFGSKPTAKVPKQHKWAHKPIKNISQILGFYLNQSLPQRLQNNTNRHTKPINPSKG